MKKLKTQKGITLVALIITIVVLLILAAVAIGAVKNSDIIGYAQNATEGYETEKGKENEAIKDAEDLLNKYANGENGGSIDAAALLAKFTENPEAFKHPEQSPTNNDRAIGTDGKPVNMDYWTCRVINEEKKEIGLNGHDGSTESVGYKGGYTEDGKIIGSMPQYIKLASYEDIYTVTDTAATFSGCEQLIVPPIIPSTETRTSGMFSYAYNLKEPPIIPVGVTDTDYMFNMCNRLEKAPIIPNTVEYVVGMFFNCSSLTEAPIIPDSVLYTDSMFYGASNLTGAIRIESANIESIWEVEYLLVGTKINKIIVPAGSATESIIREKFASDPNITIETF